MNTFPLSPNSRREYAATLRMWASMADEDEAAQLIALAEGYEQLADLDEATMQEDDVTSSSLDSLMDQSQIHPITQDNNPRQPDDSA